MIRSSLDVFVSLIVYLSHVNMFRQMQSGRDRGGGGDKREGGKGRLREKIKGNREKLI